MRNVPLAKGVLTVVILAVGVLGCEKLPEAPNVPPVASFIHSPVSPVYAGQTTVAFNASASRDSDGSVVSYTWNFGDGSAEQTADGPTAGHVFPVVGRCLEAIYTVLLTVVDNSNGRSSANQTVTVVNLPAPASVECLPPPQR